jgi:hypothetical protein
LASPESFGVAQHFENGEALYQRAQSRPVPCFLHCSDCGADTSPGIQLLARVLSRAISSLRKLLKANDS